MRQPGQGRRETLFAAAWEFLASCSLPQHTLSPAFITLTQWQESDPSPAHTGEHHLGTLCACSWHSRVSKEGMGGSLLAPKPRPPLEAPAVEAEAGHHLAGELVGPRKRGLVVMGLRHTGGDTKSAHGI